jgi:citrate/tricarballylate utilization protein
MAGVFGAVFLFAIVAWLMSFTQFWNDTGVAASAESIVPLRGAAWDAAGLTYLDGGGIGCTYPDMRPSFARRNFHHLTFYGFLLCFAATVAGTIYHYVFAIVAPYPFYSLPVILGTLGGIGLIVGPVGLMVLRARRDPDLGDRAQDGMDAAFLVLLLLTSVTGLSLLAGREAHGMGVLLALHLGAVMALFLTMPYGKLVHALFRFAALLRFHVERLRPVARVESE